jgi:hypothetical protein
MGRRRVVKSDPVRIGRKEKDIGERDLITNIIALLLIFSNFSGSRVIARMRAGNKRKDASSCR